MLFSKYKASESDFICSLHIFSILQILKTYNKGEGILHLSNYLKSTVNILLCFFYHVFILPPL